MGYTHYWTFKKPSLVKGNMDKAEATYKKALLECAKIARVYNAECEKSGDTDARLSGFSAHTKAGKYGGLELNGKGDNAHEDFVFREHFRQCFENDGYGQGAFNFCKTARKPYDLVVTACLALLKHRLGDLIDVSSDGEASNWTDGVELARRVSGLAINNPIQVVSEIVETPKSIDVTLRKYKDGETFIALTELQKYIQSNAEGFKKGSIQRATLEVLSDKIKGLA